MNLNYGCGNKRIKGYVGVDIRETSATDVIVDKNKRLPLNDNSADLILCDNVLEHVDDLGFVLSELFRVSKNGAIIEILVPHFSRSQFEYHKRLCRYSFLSCHCLGHGSNDAYPLYFREIERKLIMPKRWKNTFIDSLINKFPHKYECTPLRSFIFASQIYLKLEVIKCHI